MCLVESGTLGRTVSHDAQSTMWCQELNPHLKYARQVPEPLYDLSGHNISSFNKVNNSKLTAVNIINKFICSIIKFEITEILILFRQGLN